MCACNGAVEAAGETDRDGRANSQIESSETNMSKFYMKDK